MARGRREGDQARPRHADLEHAGRHPGQAALYGRRPRRHRPSGQPAGTEALRARAARHHVYRTAVDDPPICGLLDGGSLQRLLPQGAGRRAAGRFGGLRPGHPPRLRQRPSARRGRCRQGGRGDRLGRGHEDPVRRHPARQRVGVDDHERRGDPHPRQLHRRRRGAGRAARAAFGYHPERHPQGVHGPQHLHLPARALDAHRRRHHRVHGEGDAEVQLDLDLRLPHAGGGRDAGAGIGLHPGRRARICARGAEEGARRRRLRRPAVLLLRHRHELLHGGGQAARRAPAVDPHHGRVRAEEILLAHAAHPLPDVGRVAAGAGPLQQRHPHRLRGAVGGARRHAEPAHQRARRGDRAADGVFGPHRPQHAAHPARSSPTRPGG